MPAVSRRSRCRALACVLPFACVPLLASFHAGCDFGEPIAPPPEEQPNAATIETLLPLRTFPGDTVVVAGEGFGATAGAVLFTGMSGDVEAAIVAWEDESVRALVPSGVIDGPIRVRVGDQVSTGPSFGVAPERSFANDVTPIFQMFFCESCHGFGSGQAGFEVLPYEDLMSGPQVIPRLSGSSELRRRLLPSTPVPERMPQYGPNYLNDTQILVISDWIDQGARNN